MEVAGEVTFALAPSCCNPDTDVKTAVCLKCHSWVTAKKPAPQGWTGQPDSRTPKASSSFNKLVFHPRKSHGAGCGRCPQDALSSLGKHTWVKVSLWRLQGREGAEPKHFGFLGGESLRAGPYGCWLCLSRMTRGTKRDGTTLQRPGKLESDRTCTDTE